MAHTAARLPRALTTGSCCRDGKVRVKLSCARGESIVDGSFVSSEAVRFKTPVHEQYGALPCDVAVSIGSSGWTVNPLKLQVGAGWRAAEVLHGGGCSASVVLRVLPLRCLAHWRRCFSTVCCMPLTHEAPLPSTAFPPCLQYFSNMLPSASLAYGPGVLPQVGPGCRAAWHTFHLLYGGCC